MAKEPEATSFMARQATSKLLHFFSTANNETIGACLVGLGAVTYLILGRVGLVLIGAVGGVVLHATWDEQRGADALANSTENKRRKEIGLDIVKRLLDLQDRKAVSSRENGYTQSDIEVHLSNHKELNFNEFRPATAVALTSLVDAVIRDYVKYWYSPVLPTENSFPFACRQTLTSFILSFSSHLSHKRPADTFLNFLTNSTSIFIVFLSELSHALMAPGMYDRDVSEAIHIYLEEKPDSNLANVLNKDQHERKLKLVSDDILQTFLDAKSYNCEPVKVFLTEILSGVILESMLRTCSSPQWINEWIVYILEEGEPEIMNAIDAGVGSATGKDIETTLSTSNNRIEGEEIDSEPKDSVEVIADAKSTHQRTVSKAETAMQEAMQEAKRLTELIAVEEAKKAELSRQSEDMTSSVTSTEAWTEQSATPTSSQSDSQGPIRESRTSSDDEPNNPKSRKAAEELAPPKAFTSFDQILPPQQSSPHPSEQEPDPLTLHRAKVNIFDDGQPGDKSTMKSKPVADYLLQIEPRSSRYPGWMTARKYADFETLHEVLRRIAPISGVPEFSKRQPVLPGWKKKSKTTLCMDLEAYLQDALSFEPLAESEGMKRFLEKEQQMGRPTPSKGVLGFPTPEAFQSMGKGMLDVLGAAPKGAAVGGKAIVGGVTNIFGGQKKSSNSPQPPQSSHSKVDASRVSEDPFKNSVVPNQSPRPSQDSYNSAASLSAEVSRPPLPPNRPSIATTEQQNALGILSGEKNDVFGSQNSSTVNVSDPVSEKSLPSLLTQSDLDIELPPPPSEMPDDYKLVTESPKALRQTNQTPQSPEPIAETSLAENTETEISQKLYVADALIDESDADASLAHKTKQTFPIDEQETQVAVELIFAVINELFTLSSAWNIRRTLLNAAKTYLLRPGNPQLETIRVLLQDTVIEANSTDDGIAAHILKTRENSLPTEEELATWPPPLDEEEKEKLRLKARKLLVTKGMPQALTSVMGQAASSEALGRVFDSLQVEKVSRGLMFALLLQGLRAATH